MIDAKIDARVSVRPTQGGWIVLHGEFSPLVFSSGGRAEAGAHRLGRSLATAGADTLVVVHDRRDEVIGATRYDGARVLQSGSTAS